jgi:hypothetical protein
MHIYSKAVKNQGKDSSPHGLKPEERESFYVFIGELTE